MRKQKGITLIALVITIIVLLILAAVSITALTDEDKGVVTKAKQAASKTEDAADQEDADIKEIIDYADSEDWGSTSTGQSLASQIDASNYGDYVNYNKDLSLTLCLERESSVPKTDWRIFYKEGERVYLIAADYVPNTSSLLKISDAGMIAGGAPMYGEYSLYWNTIPSTLATTARQDSLFGITNSSYVLNASNANSLYASELLDTVNWTGFVDTSVADCAIGGPTIEMYANSWNMKGYTAITPTSENTATGYKVNGANFVNMSSDEGYGDNLYYPHKSEVGEGECLGYWLAAPSASSTDSVMGICCYGELCYEDNLNYLYGGNTGVRPVVCLKAGISATQDSNGVWQLGE